MMRRRIPYLLISIGAALGIALSWSTKAFHHDTFVLKGLACTCPDFSVVQGEWKISSPILDTISHLDKSEVYIIEHDDPWNSDPVTMYDLWLAKGEVVGVDRVSEGDPWNPVIKVTHWEWMGLGMTLGYGALKWGTILFTALGLWMMWAQRTGY